MTPSTAQTNVNDVENKERNCSGRIQVVTCDLAVKTEENH
jgi:hypothetical protein